MATEYEYTVRGAGAFPIDMLRYDWARPKGSSDSQAILNSFDIVDDHGVRNRDPRDVQVIGLNKPTVGRWQSFGWIVGEVTKRTVRL